MSIKANIENLLIQLNYPVNEATTKQLDNITKNTDNFFDFAQHLFTLSDDLKAVNAVVALSNSKDYLKLKSNSKIDSEIEKFNEIVKFWADKFKVTLQKVDNKNTYYIIGKNS